MCGRYALAADADELVEAFDLPALDFDRIARYNIAPGQDAPVVAEDSRGRRLGPLRWGLVPSWANEPGKGLINARGESIRVKPSFAEAFERRRCLVPATGFYEWTREGGRKAPYWLHPAAGEILSFAGIWERWARPGSDPRYTFAILTTDASEDVRPVHHRMPVIVARADRDVWLDRDADSAALGELLRPAPEGTLERRPVSTRVNSPAEDDEGLISSL